MTRRGLFIGVDAYSNLTPLAGAVADARAMRDFFGGRWPGRDVEIFENPRYPGEVTERVRRAREGLGRGDLLLVYFAGHGVVQGMEPRLLCAEAHRDSVMRDSDVVKLQEWRDATRGPQDTVIVIDACQEDIVREGMEAQSKVAEQAAVIEKLQREIEALKAQGIGSRGLGRFLFGKRDLSFATGGTGSPDPGGEAAAAQHGRPRGDGGEGLFAVIHSCQPGSFANEFDGHGMFTRAFLDEVGDAAEKGLRVCVDVPFRDRVNARMERLCRRLEDRLRRTVPDGDAEIVQHAMVIPALAPVEILPGAADSRDFAKATERARTEAKSGEGFSCESAGIRMVWCMATTSGDWRRVHDGVDFFHMGSPADEPGRDFLSQDDPAMAEYRHAVRLMRHFWIGETPVTQRQWKAVMGTTVEGQCRKALRDDAAYEWPGSSRVESFRQHKRAGLDTDPSGFCFNEEDDCPVYFVSWEEAAEFCERLTAAESKVGRLPAGYRYRLPTEAEWEYACRAGVDQALPNGERFELANRGMDAKGLEAIAWYGGNSFEDWNGRGLDPAHYGRRSPNPYWRMAPRQVHRKDPNSWGATDMLGNVWEWCLDWAGRYPANMQTDPQGPASGRHRIVRGGSWQSDASECRPAARWRHEPGFRNWTVGFRVVLGSDPGGR